MVLCHKIQIPLDRFNAAFWVYQMSILTVMVNIISSAYNACIIAHEKMEAFAYISLIDALGKLMIAYSLIHVMNSDRLVMYGGLIYLCNWLIGLFTVYIAVEIFQKQRLVSYGIKLILQKCLNLLHGHLMEVLSQ